MTRLFEARLEAERLGGGTRAAALYLAAAMVDVLRNGLAERLDPVVRRWRERGTPPAAARAGENRRWAIMDHLLKDARHALRGMLRSPGFAAVAIVTIGLGIGANTAIYSVVQTVLLRPLPYANPDRLVLIWGEMVARNVKYFPSSPPDLRDYRERTTVFEGVAGVVTFAQPLSGDDGQPEQIQTAGVTTNIFSLLGVRPIVGRDLVAEDGATLPPNTTPNSPNFVNGAALLSHALWRQRYGSDPGVVGKVVDVGGSPTEIVGVLPADFELLMPASAALGKEPMMWIAARLDFDGAPRNNVFLRPIGRLKAGVTVAQAQAEMDRLGERLQEEEPIRKAAGSRIDVVPMHDDLVANVRPVILALTGAVAFVLLIACANVANLLLVRASARERELAVRAAVGGSRWRLVQQMLAESLILSIAGGLLGVVLAMVGVKLLVAMRPAELPRIASIGIDGGALAFTMLAVVVAAVAFGVIPAWRASRPQLAEVLREGGRTGGLAANRALRNGVVMAEVALSLVLLIGAGLMLRSFSRLQQIDPGFEPDHLLTFGVTLPFARYPGIEQRLSFNARLKEGLSGLPGVRAVTGVFPLPLSGGLANVRWGTEEAATAPEKFRQADSQFVLPGYFETMGTQLIAGRTFTAADDADSANVVVIDELLAKRAFPRESAIGKRLLVRVTTLEPVWIEVIGVVEHQRASALTEPGRELMYFTDHYVGSFGALSWVVRTGTDPVALAAAVRAKVAELDPLVPVADVRPMNDYMERAMAQTRFALVLIGIFGAIALVLASVGLYGVLAYAVRQRTAEIGVRIAFGAAPRSILRLVVGEGLALGSAGVAVGVIAAFALTRMMSGLLFGVTATDPATFAIIAVLFLGVAAAASAIPALRAARVDPLVALREE